jgi:hypothetical protein
MDGNLKLFPPYNLRVRLGDAAAPYVIRFDAASSTLALECAP